MGTDAGMHARNMRSNARLPQKIKMIVDEAETQAALRKFNAKSQFRAQATSLNSIEGGHFICEVRQWTLQGKSRAAAWAWMLTLGSDHLEDGSKAEWEELLAELL